MKNNVIKLFNCKNKLLVIIAILMCLMLESCSKKVPDENEVEPSDLENAIVNKAREYIGWDYALGAKEANCLYECDDNNNQNEDSCYINNNCNGTCSSGANLWCTYALDCSGLTHWAYKFNSNQMISIAYGTWGQWNCKLEDNSTDNLNCKKYSLDDIHKGDLIFMGTAEYWPKHVALFGGWHETVYWNFPNNEFCLDEFSDGYYMLYGIEWNYAYDSDGNVIGYNFFLEDGKTIVEASSTLDGIFIDDPCKTGDQQLFPGEVVEVPYDWASGTINDCKDLYGNNVVRPR